MSDWLRYIAMIFYSTIRVMPEVRDRGTLFPAIVSAYLAQLAYLFAVQWLIDRTLLARPQVIASNFFQAAASLLPIAIVIVPLLALMSNMFDRRGSFGLMIQQEYASLATVVFYALVAANLMTILVSIFFHFSGVQAAYVASSMQSAGQIKSMFNFPAELQKELEKN